MRKTRYPVDPDLERMRHSAAHLMAAAIQQIWPAAKFGVGPTTRNGFYYDVDLPEHLTTKDLERIETRMLELRKEKVPFERVEVPLAEARSLMASAHQTYKCELIQLIEERGSTAVAKATGDDALVDASASGKSTVTLYRTGDFVDLCRGPHVEHSGDIGVFKLQSIAGAYWRGDEKNAQLQRIYAVCYRDNKELRAELKRLEEVRRRDHRKLGKELGIFTVVDEVGAGLPFWLPAGTVIRKELERLATEFERQDGYMSVATPVIGKEDLYRRSGHIPYYQEDMYSPIEIESQMYFLRPMNCPHHHMLFGSSRRSYRELPFRVAEYGLCHRFEASGALSGLMRVRGFTQNDAHIYCRMDQAKEEFIRVMNLHSRYYRLFEIEEFFMRFSLPDLERLDKYIDEPEKWVAAMNIVRAAMEESGLPYEESEGDAAFYGPKIDFIIESVVGTEYAISTNQLDFLATERFNLSYVGEDGAMHPVYVIHRAPLGSHERFTAFLIEHFAGRFPTWLAPTQVRILPVTEAHIEYAMKVHQNLFGADIDTGTGGLRVDVDSSAERLQKKIRSAQLAQIPYIIVVGDREVEEGAVNVRLRDGRQLGAMALDSLLERLRAEIRTRKDLKS